MKKLASIHPGAILLTDFLQPLGVSQYRMAKDIGAPPRRINETVKGRRATRANTALRLARYFATSDHFWLNLQNHYDPECERYRLGESLQEEVQILSQDK